MSGVRVASPFVNMLNVLSMLVGVGGATLVSIAMGKRQPDRANHMFTISIVLSIAFGAIFALIVAPLSPVIAAAASSDPATAEYTATFLQIVSAASPVYILASVMAILLRSDACIKLSSLVLSIAGVANVVFDLLFIGVLGLGIAGSALATDMGMLTAVLLSLFYFRWPKRTLKLVNPFSPPAEEKDPPSSFLGESIAICKNGASSGLRMFLACMALLFLNFIVGEVVGVMGIALMTVCGNIQLLAVAFFSAAGQAATPMEGVLFGERDCTGIRLLFAYVMKVTVVSVIIIITLVCLFAGPIISLFCPDGDPVEGSELLLGLYAIGFLPLAINYILTYYYNTVQQRKVSTILTVCENLAIYLPMIWILTTLLGLRGTVLAFVVSECLTLVATFAVVSVTRSKKGFSNLLLLPPGSSDVISEVSSDVSNADAASLAHEMKAALDRNGADPSTALRSAMAIEEIVAATAKRQADDASIDARLLESADAFTLCLRDNAAPFDPIAAGDAESDEFDNLSVLASIAQSVHYARVLGLNQTVIAIGKNSDSCEKHNEERQ